MDVHIQYQELAMPAHSLLKEEEEQKKKRKKKQILKIHAIYGLKCTRTELQKETY